MRTSSLRITNQSQSTCHMLGRALALAPGCCGRCRRSGLDTHEIVRRYLLSSCGAIALASTLKHTSPCVRWRAGSADAARRRCLHQEPSRPKHGLAKAISHKRARWRISPTRVSRRVPKLPTSCWWSNRGAAPRTASPSAKPMMALNGGAGGEADRGSRPHGHGEGREAVEQSQPAAIPRSRRFTLRQHPPSMTASPWATSVRVSDSLSLASTRGEIRTA